MHDAEIRTWAGVCKMQPQQSKSTSLNPAARYPPATESLQPVCLLVKKALHRTLHSANGPLLAAQPPVRRASKNGPVWHSVIFQLLIVNDNNLSFFWESLLSNTNQGTHSYSVDFLKIIDIDFLKRTN